MANILDVEDRLASTSLGRHGEVGVAGARVVRNAFLVDGELHVVGDGGKNLLGVLESDGHVVARCLLGELADVCDGVLLGERVLESTAVLIGIAVCR